MSLLSRYARWLHTQWPAGLVEKLPEARADGSTNIPGLYVAGDLTGIPLLKFALDAGTRVARAIAEQLSRAPAATDGVVDLAILGAGVAGMAAAVEAKQRGLSFRLIEANEPLSTLVNLPREKPIYTYPKAMTPAGSLTVTAEVKEALLDELRAQVASAGVEVTLARAERIRRQSGLFVVELAGQETQPGAAAIRARRVLVAIGRTGNYRRLGCPGETLDKVYNRLLDPRDFAGQRALVVGGGDSACETAIALARSGAAVTLSYRKRALARPKPENQEQLEALAPARIALELGTEVREIRPGEVVLAGADGAAKTVPNDVVFAMIGREAPLDFFRRSGVRIAGELTPARLGAMALFILFCVFLYNWKSGGVASDFFARHHWFPFAIPGWLAACGGRIAAAARDPKTLLGTFAISAAGPAFWYTLAYSAIVVVFGIRRIRRRRTPYVTAQTLTLMAIQVLPLFLLPEIILPQLNYHGLLPRGLADALFPVVTYGHGREFWRAYGLILAFPLDVYNVFTHQPLWWWIGIGAVQTFVLIPLGVYFYGKGFYCGWICSCGALAETLGDTQRHKMVHGPRWNRFNMVGQGVLTLAFVLLAVRIVGWLLPDGNALDRMFEPVFLHDYKWGVDVLLAGVVGYGVYFWYSGRFWCRFFCPLAALMHIYARFSRFRILADKKKCISCNVCTSVCHQGIDVMSFAQKGQPMSDPECVRCSACVQSCPTGVLSFGQVGSAGQVIRVDRLAASLVQLRESR